MEERLSYRGHARALLVLGVPLAGSHLAQMAIGITDNVVELMAEKIQRLARPSQDMLTLAACTLAATRTEFGRRHARPLAFAMGIGVAAILTWSNVFEDPGDPKTTVLESLIDACRFWTRLWQPIAPGHPRSPS